jgi:hypothetical protein
MNLIQFLALFGLFVAGMAIACPFARFVPLLPEALIEVTCGMAAVLFFGWAVYRRCGWMARAPRCPKCGSAERAYSVIPSGPDGIKLECQTCKQVLMLQSESAVVLGDHGEEVGHLRLRWPKILGWWKADRPFEIKATD